MEYRDEGEDSELYRGRGGMIAIGVVWGECGCDGVTAEWRGGAQGRGECDLTTVTEQERVVVKI